MKTFIVIESANPSLQSAQFELLIKRLKTNEQLVSGIHFPKTEPQFLRSVVEQSKQFSATDGFKAALNACVRKYLSSGKDRISQSLTSDKNVVTSNYILTLSARLIEAMRSAEVELPSVADIAEATEAVAVANQLTSPPLTIYLESEGVAPNNQSSKRDPSNDSLDLAYDLALAEYKHPTLVVDCAPNGQLRSPEAIHEEVWQAFTSLSSEQTSAPDQKPATASPSQVTESDRPSPALPAEQDTPQSLQLTLGEWYYRAEKDASLDVYNPFDPSSIKHYFQGPHQALTHAEWCDLNHLPLFHNIPETEPIILVRPGERLLVHSQEFYYAPLDNPLISPYNHNGVLMYLKSNVAITDVPQRFIFELVNLNQRVSVVLALNEPLAQIALKAHEQMVIVPGAAAYKQLATNWTPQLMLPRIIQRQKADDDGEFAEGVRIAHKPERSNTESKPAAKPDEPVSQQLALAAQNTQSLNVKESAATAANPASSLEITLEGVSELMTQELLALQQAGRLKLTRQPTNYTKKDDKGNYRYLTPKSLSAQAAREFERSMNDIYARYATMQQQLEERAKRHNKTQVARAREALHSVLPMASTRVVTLAVSPEHFEALTLHLLSHNSYEAREIGATILEKHGAVNSGHNSATMQKRAQHIRNRRLKLAEKIDGMISPGLGLDNTTYAKLISRQPLNEFDLLALFLFETQSVSMEDLSAAIGSLPYEERRSLLISMLKHAADNPAGSQLRAAQFGWEIVSDIVSMQRILAGKEWQARTTIQPLTPRLGYDMARSVEAVGLDEDYEQCFDLSYQLYSSLQALGYEHEAQYSVLKGHRVRWQLACRGDELLAGLIASFSQKNARKVPAMLIDTLHEPFPLLGEVFNAQFKIAK